MKHASDFDKSIFDLFMSRSMKAVSELARHQGNRIHYEAEQISKRLHFNATERLRRSFSIRPSELYRFEPGIVAAYGSYMALNCDLTNYAMSLSEADIRSGKISPENAARKLIGLSRKAQA
ncbi:MAG: hypothetical protein KJ871_04250 [Alphaproteobacteria bacterium]|nr:hypothetical protein [Alphaproteobacteria bacterium]MBU2142753.1 hypothetical protein [Alphaproteobacteria bacterium]MBU2195175.1 hypothetical protein [Alphaproteobacteria bacterium]